MHDIPRIKHELTLHQLELRPDSLRRNSIIHLLKTIPPEAILLSILAPARLLSILRLAIWTLSLWSVLSLTILRLAIWPLSLWSVLSLTILRSALGIILVPVDKRRTNLLSFPDRESLFAGGTLSIHPRPFLRNDQFHSAMRTFYFQFSHFLFPLCFMLHRFR